MKFKRGSGGAAGGGAPPEAAGSAPGPSSRSPSPAAAAEDCGGGAGGGKPKRRSSLSKLFGGKGPSTSALMEAGEWDAVLAKMEQKAARAEEWEAEECARERGHQNQRGSTPPAAAEREGEMSAAAAALIGEDYGSDDDSGGGAGGSGHRRGSGVQPRGGGGAAAAPGHAAPGGGGPRPQRRGSAIRRTSSTFGQTNFIGQNFLLRTLSEHPRTVPVRVVAKMIDIDPDSVKERDFCGNSALHVAVDLGCDLEVVEHLLGRNADMAGWANHEGRTPLHLAAAPYCMLESNHPQFRRPADIRTIASVFLACPLNVVKTDRDGRTPPMVARSAKSAPEAVQFLWDRAAEYEERIHDAEGELERLAEEDEIDIPPEGLTLPFIAERVNESYGEWRAGLAGEMFDLEGGGGGEGAGAGENGENGGRR